MTEPDAVKQARNTFMSIRGVSGVSYDGSSIIVYVEKEHVKSYLPRLWKGLPVTAVVAGRFS